MSELPPWEPIADWLCKLEDGDHGPVSKGKQREYHETEAKAIAYDIATHGSWGSEPIYKVGSDQPVENA